MNRTGRILKYLSMVVAALLGVAGLTLAWLALIPPKPLRAGHPAVPDQSAFKLDEKVGWYQTDDDRRLMVTWGSTGGLTVNQFAPIDGGDLVPVTPDDFTWKPYYLAEEYRTAFLRNPGGGVAGMEWTTADGRRRRAVRLERYGYDQAEVRYRNGGVELVGLLMTPVTDGPHPAVAFIHGSGTSIRDFSYYLHMADYLARHGCVVLLPDKRGCGKSGGEWLTSRFADYADDALAAVEYLGGVPAADPERIGLLGISQGGWILPLAAARSGRVRFIVSVSGSAVSIGETMRHEIAEDIRDRGFPGWLNPLLTAVFDRRAEQRLGAFWRLNGAFDPLPYWRELAVPALVLNGLRDKNVPVRACLARFAEFRRLNPKAEITLATDSQSGHCLVDPRTARDPRLGGAREAALAQIAEWIRSVTQ